MGSIWTKNRRNWDMGLTMVSATLIGFLALLNSAQGAYTCGNGKGVCTSMFSGCQSGWSRDTRYYCSLFNYCCMPPTEPVTSKPDTTHKPIVQEQNCGVSSFPAYVVNGVNAKQGSWPWQISLRHAFKGHICGGTLVAKNWIVTAAHCFMMTTNPNYYTVVVGEHHEGINHGTERSHKIAKIIRHHNWKDAVNGQLISVNGDIALIKLASNVDLASEYANTICLPSSTDDFSNDKDCFVTGWGLTMGGNDRQILQELQGSIVDKSVCRRYFQDVLTDKMLCFGTLTSGACSGDSGGPLACRRNGKFHLAGVVSFGEQTCSGAPGVFTKVTAYKSWIDQQIGSN